MFLEQIEDRVECVLRNNKNKRFLFILDGFDEFGSKENLCEKVFALGTNRHIKVIVTSRTYYVQKDDINNCFQYRRVKSGKSTSGDEYVVPFVYFICAFNEQQRADFVKNVIENAKRLSENYIDFLHFDTVEEYMVHFQKNIVLRELASTPFTLRLVTTILPQLDAEMKRQKELEEALQNKKGN
jgi:hypothetical protein